MIREMTESDFVQFWPTFESIIKSSNTYAFDPDLDFATAYQLWCVSPSKTFVFEEHGEVLGSYYLKPNAMGPGSHICNCGYMVRHESRGKGIARQMCLHSQQVAMDIGYRAMQFNSVVSTNEGAVRLWLSLGFEKIGTIPNGYRHSQLGYVDSYILYKALQR